MAVEFCTSTVVIGIFPIFRWLGIRSISSGFKWCFKKKMATLTNFTLPKYFPNSTFHNSTAVNNHTGLSPYNISIFPTISPPPIYIPAVVVSNDDSSFYAYDYYYFALLGLLVLAGVWAKYAAQRRQQATRAALNQRLRARQANTTVTTISNGQMGTNEVSNSNNNNTTPKDDFPPAYDEVMQTYINAKLELQAQEESGAVGGGGMSAAVSSITIETEVDTTASTNDLTVTSSTTTTTVPPDTQTQPPPYESPNGLRSKNDNVV